MNVGRGGTNMKIRLTILTENKKQRPEELTEEQVAKAWQSVLNLLCACTSDETATVERCEFVEETE